ncbi:endospore germination permease [Natroniella sulfidigena]|uniref:GerAB/ArcD/ProY family transporter n=1 Tax=Natroniella sulfidigena TaxID=723921 RepID=UPI002009F885|nr:endospore germination permease [Natroniella sulfidigena]MCK8815817.1 endospore germination permease [Natroniella sulfidigena]
MNREIISRGQAVFLLFVGLFNTKFLIINTYLAEVAGRDGWLAVPGGYLAGFCLSLFIIKLANLFPEQTFIEYLPQVLGTILGKFLGFVYIISFILYVSLITRLNTEVLIILMPETPPLAFNLLMVGLTIYVVKKGFEVYVRTCQFFVPFVLTGLIIIFLVGIERGSLERFRPFLEFGMEPVFIGSLRVIALLSMGVVFMAFWLAYLRKLDLMEQISGGGFFIVMVQMLMIVVLIISVLGVESTLFHTFPIFSVTRLLEIADFLKGFEGILTIVWFPIAYMTIAGYFFPVAVGIGQWLNLEDYKPLVLPLALIVLGVAMVPENFEMLKNSLEDLSMYLVLPLAGLFPVYYLIARVRGVGESD